MLAEVNELARSLFFYLPKVHVVYEHKVTALTALVNGSKPLANKVQAVTITIRPLSSKNQNHLLVKSCN